MLQMVPNHYQYLQLANTLHTTYTAMKQMFTYPFYPLFYFINYPTLPLYDMGGAGIDVLSSIRKSIIVGFSKIS